MAGPERGSWLDRWFRRTPDELEAEKARKAEADRRAFFAPRAGDRELEAPVRAPVAGGPPERPANRASLPRNPAPQRTPYPRGAAPVGARTPPSAAAPGVDRTPRPQVGPIAHSRPRDPILDGLPDDFGVL